jgi:hypothetical protein
MSYWPIYHNMTDVPGYTNALFFAHHYINLLEAGIRR